MKCKVYEVTQEYKFAFEQGRKQGAVEELNYWRCFIDRYWEQKTTQKEIIEARKHIEKRLGELKGEQK